MTSPSTAAPAAPGASRAFADYCCELLGSVGPCTAKRMFGGWGISTDGLTIAIIADLGGGERLWLKADEISRLRFEAAGCERFVYTAKARPMSMNYYSAPEEAMDAPGAMHLWALSALESALKARQPSVKRALSAIDLKVKKPPPGARRAGKKPAKP